MGWKGRYRYHNSTSHCRHYEELDDRILHIGNEVGKARISKALGRPALVDSVIVELWRLRGEGLSFKKIQLATGVPVATMHKYLVADDKIGSVWLWDLYLTVIDYCIDSV